MNDIKTRTEYALDYGAGLMCVSDDSADAAEMAQFVPGSRVVARTVTEGEWEPVDQGSEPDPEPWTLIPAGRENAAVLRVNGVVLGPVWLENRSVLIDSVSAALEKKHLVAYAHQITSVERVQVVPEGARVLGEDKVAVPRELDTFALTKALRRAPKRSSPSRADEGTPARAEEKLAFTTFATVIKEAVETYLAAADRGEGA